MAAGLHWHTALHATADAAPTPARSFVVTLPASLPLEGAAPLLCAGITVYSPLRYYGLDKPGKKVGCGGLAHSPCCWHGMLLPQPAPGCCPGGGPSLQ